MATIVNERDVLIRSAPSRLIDHDLASNVNVPTFKGISLAAPGAIFRVAVNGDVSPTSITLTAAPRGFSETPAITWSVVYGDLGTDPVGTGLTYEMVAANMLTDVVTVQVSVTSSGMTYTDAVMFVKIQDGSIGLPGSRGSINAVRAITGTAWSSLEATMALIDFGLEDPFDPIAGDVVTLHNLNAGFSEIRRYSGSVWVLEAPAFPGKNILKGSVATEQLLVTGMAESLNADPNTVDITAWVGNGITVVADTTAPNGATALRCAGQGTTVLSRKFAVNASDNYRVQTWAKADSGAPTAFLMVAFYDAAGDVISGSSSPSGWTSSGDFHYFGLANQVMPTTWTHYDASFGLDETFKVPAGATHAAIGLISNFSSGTVQRISGMVCRRKVDGRVVVDGSLAARHIDSKGLTVRNGLGEVLLEASGDSAPPWVVQEDLSTVLNASEAGALQIAKPPDASNRSFLRSLKTDNKTLISRYSASGSSIELLSTSRDLLHAYYKSGFNVAANSLVVLPEGHFSLEPSTYYVLRLSVAATELTYAAGSQLKLQLRVRNGMTVSIGGTTYTATSDDTIIPIAEATWPSFPAVSNIFEDPTYLLRIKSGTGGGLVTLEAICTATDLTIQEGTWFDLQRITNAVTPPATVIPRQGVLAEPPTLVAGTSPSYGTFVAGTAPWSYTFTASMDVVRWGTFTFEASYDFDPGTGDLQLHITHWCGHWPSSGVLTMVGSGVVKFTLATGIPASERPRWGLACNSSMLSSTFTEGGASAVSGTIEANPGYVGISRNGTLQASMELSATFLGEVIGPAVKLLVNFTSY